MNIEVAEDTLAALPEYARVPIAFEVGEILDPHDLAGTAGRRRLTVRPATPVFIKDYDVIPENGPLDWARTSDLANLAHLRAWMPWAMAEPSPLEVIEERIATEAADALTQLALEQPGIDRVQIRCDPKNVASAGIPRRLAFRHVLTIENETFAPPGSLRDTMVWEIDSMAIR